MLCNSTWLQFSHFRGEESEGDLPSVPTPAGVRDYLGTGGVSPSQGGRRKTKPPPCHVVGASLER